jgi:hypothetical protein
VTEYGLELGFDTDDPEFCRGFEAADVYNAVKRFAESEAPDDGPPETWTETVHATNAEMMLRIAERFGMGVHSEEVGGGWMHVVFTRPG